MHPVEETKIALALLEKKYSGKEWACFDEFRTSTNTKERETYIDFYAVGMWSNNKKIIAFEIKTFRQDFTNDVNTFMNKHGYALSISNEFYYVCQKDLISKEEVPEQAGLIHVEKAGRLRTVKQAQFRNNDMNFTLAAYQALARRASKKPVADIQPGIIRFMDKEMSEEDVENELERRFQRIKTEVIRKEAYELFKEEKQKNLVYERFYNKIKKATYGDRADFIDSYKDVQKDVLTKLRILDEIDEIMLTFSDLKDLLDGLPKIKSAVKKFK